MGFVDTLQNCYDAPAMKMTRLIQHIKAPREMVYHALSDPNVIEIWKVPNDMTCEVHAFQARGGNFRITLTYDAPTAVGKITTPATRITDASSS